MLVDSDIHVGYETLLDLLDYLDRPTRELVVHSGTNGLGMPSYPWYHPTGWLRGDTYDREATEVGAQLIGQDLDRVRENVLDAYDVTYGILTPDEAAAFSILPNPHWDFDEPAQTLRRLPAEWRGAVAHGNARSFYRLPSPVSA
jgi:hypothetical protein